MADDAWLSMTPEERRLYEDEMRVVVEQWVASAPEIREEIVQRVLQRLRAKAGVDKD